MRSFTLCFLLFVGICAVTPCDIPLHPLLVGSSLKPELQTVTADFRVLLPISRIGIIIQQFSLIDEVIPHILQYLSGAEWRDFITELQSTTEGKRFYKHLEPFIDFNNTENCSPQLEQIRGKKLGFSFKIILKKYFLQISKLTNNKTAPPSTV